VRSAENSVLSLKAQIPVRTCRVLGNIQLPEEIFLGEQQDSKLQLKSPWRVESGMRIRPGSDDLQCCISSTDPKEKREFFIPMYFLLSSRPRN
jgi:hypothetical protein